MPNPAMVKGKWYDLRPPSVVDDIVLPRVLCEYQVLDHPDEFCVKGYPGGISDGDAEMVPFILKLSGRGTTGIPTLSDDQDD